MTSTILVQPNNPLDVRPEALRDLVEEIKELGHDASLAYYDPKAGTFAVTWWEVVTIWVGAEVGKAAINQIVALAAEWMRNRFARDPDNRRPKVVRIARFEGNEGEIVEVVELRTPQDEPLRKTPEAFEAYTRTKPPTR